jgi:hypothetical protein
MAIVKKIHIHGPKKIRFEEDQVKDTRWVSVFADDFEVVLFDCDLEDIRAGLYRAEMEVYDADSA